MKLKVVPARQGVIWVRQGFEVFFKQPLVFAGLFGGFLFFALLVLSLPKLGPLLLLASLPLVSLGFMLATQQVQQGRFRGPSVIFEPLRVSRRQTHALLKMSALYAATSVVSMMLSHWVDGGKFAALQNAMGNTKGSAEEIAALLMDRQLHLGLLLRVALAALLAVPFWHAPALVHWGALGIGKALFFSSVACWKNWSVFVLYGLTWSAVIFVLATLADVLARLVLSPQWVVMMVIPVGLMLSSVIYASFYFTFADCFTPDDETVSLPA